MSKSPTGTVRPEPETQLPDPYAFSVNEFCERHRISRTLLYDLWKRGEGPKRMRVSGRTLISTEAAAEWRRQMTANEQT